MDTKDETVYITDLFREINSGTILDDFDQFNPIYLIGMVPKNNEDLESFLGITCV